MATINCSLTKFNIATMPQKEHNGTCGTAFNHYAYFLFVYETTKAKSCYFCRTKIISWMISTCVRYTGVMGDKVSLHYNVIKILSRIKPLPAAHCEFILSLTAVTANFWREGFYRGYIVQLKRLLEFSFRPYSHLSTTTHKGNTRN